MDGESVAIIAYLIAAAAVIYYLTDIFVRLPGSPRVKFWVGAAVVIGVTFAVTHSGK